MNTSLFSILLRTCWIFLPIAAGLTLVFAAEYVNEQQILRLGANEPQEWLVSQPQSAIPAQSVEISTDASPFVDTYDSTDKPISGNGFLHGSLPVLPQGVLTDALRENRNFVTWQPESGIRQALVVRADNSGGYTVSGRSLAYIEKEESSLTTRTAIEWIVTMIGTFIISLLSAIFFLRLKLKIKLKS